MGPRVKPEDDARGMWRPAVVRLCGRFCFCVLTTFCSASASGFRLPASLSSSSPATVVVAIAADLHRPARAVQCADAPYSRTRSSYAPSSRTRSLSSGSTRGPMPNPGSRLPPRGHGLRRAAATAAPPDNPRRIRHTPHRPSPRACARNTRRQRITPPPATPLDRHQSAGPSPLPHHPHPAIATV